MLHSMEFLFKTINYDGTWPEACSWMCHALNLMVRLDEKPGMMCSCEEFHERPYRGPVLPSIHDAGTPQGQAGG